MKEVIVILHGWGSAVSGERYKDVKKILEKKGFSVFTPDMPGFGKSGLKKDELFFEDYVEFVRNFVIKNKLKRIILLGHSFGGRVAIRFTSLYPQYVSKLILTGASGIPHPLPSLKKKSIYYATKVLRPLFLLPGFSLLYQSFRKLIYYSIGEMDYYKAGNLAQTFKNVYQVSIIPDLTTIKVPTFIIWGEKDTITPVKDAYCMHEKTPQSKLTIIPGATHKLPYESPSIFSKEVLQFLQ